MAPRAGLATILTAILATVGCAALAGAASGCVISPVRSAALVTGAPRPPSAAPVRVVATAEVPDAEELAIVEVHGLLPQATIGALVDEFRARVAAAGGDVGRLDSWATRYQVVAESFTFECGATEAVTSEHQVWRAGPDGGMEWVSEPVTEQKFVSRTCQGERPVEVATRTLIGRALRARGGGP